VNFGSSRIFSANQTAAALANASKDEDTKEQLRKLNARAEKQEQYLYITARELTRLTRINTQWNEEGTPPVRDEAA